jgi:hypothetical protein
MSIHNEWTWTDGAKIANQPGSYGQLGSAANGNIPPGRWDAASWMDNGGNLWLFGGYGYAIATNSTGTLLNDLWEFSTSLHEWTWMGGNNAFPQSANGWPGAYGTLGTAATGNMPGSRAGAANWVDANGNLWLFGGTGFDATGTSGGLDDLWKYSPSTNEWTWMGGSSTVGANGARPGVYGTLGVPSSGNIPGGRGEGASWTDQTGNFGCSGAAALMPMGSGATSTIFGNSIPLRRNGPGWAAATHSVIIAATLASMAHWEHPQLEISPEAGSER